MAQESKSREGSVCLAIIYNHKYEKNIDILERIYAGRFSHIYHIMPFYRGNKPNVIGVYENSYQFSGYVAQAAKCLSSGGFSHYVFVADDMALSPGLDERNIIKRLQLDGSTAFLTQRPRIFDRKWAISWPHGLTSLAFMNQKGNACEWHAELPSLDLACLKFKSHGLDLSAGVDGNFWAWVHRWVMLDGERPYFWRLLPMCGRIARKISKGGVLYPMAFGYSDFFVVPTSAFDEFCHLCGVMSAMRIFVEVAIPTAMVLSCARICSLEDIGLKAETGVDDYSVRKRMELDTSMSYARLVEKFPSDYIYIHPIKLSKWKDLP